MRPKSSPQVLNKGVNMNTFEDRKRGYEAKYLKDQEAAMLKEKGIWSGKFIYPEEWRKKNK